MGSYEAWEIEPLNSFLTEAVLPSSSEEVNPALPVMTSPEVISLKEPDDSPHNPPLPPFCF